MQKFIPIFPLAMVAFPGEVLHLHIFEERYKQLINECVEEDKTFGIPPVAEKRMLDYGTEMRVLRIDKRYATGELDITVEGLHAFRMLERLDEVPDKLYMGAVVDILDNRNILHGPTQRRLSEAVKKLFELLEIEKEILPSASKYYSFELGHLVGIEMLQEYELLKHESEAIRQRILLEHIRTMLPSVQQMADILERARLNGHFRITYPPDLK